MRKLLSAFLAVWLFAVASAAQAGFLVNPYVSYPPAGGGAGLAIVSTATYTNGDSQATTHNVTMPASLVSGNTLLYFCAINGTPTVTDPSGWTVTLTKTNGDTYRIYSKIASGSDTMSVGLNATNRMGCTGYQISGARNAVTSNEIAVSSASDANTANPDPPSLTPSWGSAANLWIAAQFQSDANSALNTYPSGYTDFSCPGSTCGQLNGLNGTGTGGAGTGAATAALALTATSVDPGTFGMANAKTRSAYSSAAAAMMKVIRMVSSIHVLWGISLMLLPVPRPFGALEPYFLIFSEFWAGAALVFSGALPLLVLRARWFRCLLCAVVPQQMLLFWALITSLRDVFGTHDGRVILALCYLLPMTAYHLVEVADLAEHFFYKRLKEMNGSDLAALLGKYAGEIIATILSPIILGLVGYWKLKRLGVNSSNIAEIEDRARFRQSLLDRISAVERENVASLERERALQRQNAEQATQIALLRLQVDSQEAEIRDLTAEKQLNQNEIEGLKREVRSLNSQLGEVSRSQAK